jgi:hypothetical protein
VPTLEIDILSIGCRVFSRFVEARCKPVGLRFFGLITASTSGKIRKTLKYNGGLTPSARSTRGSERQGGKPQRQHYPAQAPNASDPIILKILKNMKDHTIAGVIAHAHTPRTLASTAKSRT